MKRTLLGALLFLILVGEPTVGRTRGLFTPIGIVVFAILYISYFLLFDGLVHNYRLNNLQMVLANFAMYSVLITGLLHGEIRDYVLHPHNDLITSLIRIQCSLYPLYVYPLLKKLAPNTKPILTLPASALIFIAAILVLSLSRHFGAADMIDTFRVAPLVAAFFIICASAGLLVAATVTRSQKYKQDRSLALWSWILLVIALVPSLSFFVLLVCSMILVSTYFLSHRSFRHTTYVGT